MSVPLQFWGTFQYWPVESTHFGRGNIFYQKLYRGWDRWRQKYHPVSWYFFAVGDRIQPSRRRGKHDASHSSYCCNRDELLPVVQYIKSRTQVTLYQHFHLQWLFILVFWGIECLGIDCSKHARCQIFLDVKAFVFHFFRYCDDLNVHGYPFLGADFLTSMTIDSTHTSRLSSLASW